MATNLATPQHEFDANEKRLKDFEGGVELPGIRLVKAGSSEGIVLTLTEEEQKPFIEAAHKVLQRRQKDLSKAVKTAEAEAKAAAAEAKTE